MTKLEDHRLNEITQSYISFSLQEQAKVFRAYESHAIKAFGYTFADIVELENSKISWIRPGQQAHSAIAFWFLCLESFINCLLKSACVKLKLDVKTFMKQDLTPRLSSLLQLFEIDRKSFNQLDSFSKLNEFCLFRNELFHDRHNGK